jgi:hypothetical protein
LNFRSAAIMAVESKNLKSWVQPSLNDRLCR